MFGRNKPEYKTFSFNQTKVSLKNGGEKKLNNKSKKLACPIISGTLKELWAPATRPLPIGRAICRALLKGSISKKNCSVQMKLHIKVTKNSWFLYKDTKYTKQCLIKDFQTFNQNTHLSASHDFFSKTRIFINMETAHN